MLSTASELHSFLLIEELLSLPKNVFQLSQLQKVLLEGLGILINLSEFVFQLLESGLKINHLSRLGRLWGVATVQHWDFIFLNLLLQEPQLSFHLIASSDLIDKLPLEGIYVRVKIPELDQAQLPELRDAVVGGLGLEEQLAQGHLLAPEQGAPGDRDWSRVPLHGCVL